MKRFLLTVLLSFIFGFCWIGSGKAQVGLEKVGQSTMNFLKVGVSPTAAAMGNAFVVLGEGAESMFYNPSGMADAPNYSAFLANTQWIADIAYTAGGITKNIGNLGTIGISFMTVDYGDITHTRLLEASDPKGYEELGNLDVGAYAIGFAYARKISNQFNIGGQIQYVGQELGETTLSSGTITNDMKKLTLSFGIKFDTGYKGFELAMSMRNFSSAAKYEEVSATLPMLFASGVTIDLLDIIQPSHSDGTHLKLAAEFQHPNNFTERLNVGAEYSMGFMALRGGYEFNRDLGGMSAGVGLTPTFRGSQIQINYSYSVFDVFDSVSRFSLVIFY